jgi:hypothetical protein
MNENQNPTFEQFVNDMFLYVFDGLIRGGTKEMKNRVRLAIARSAEIAASGGFSKE